MFSLHRQKNLAALLLALVLLTLGVMLSYMLPPKSSVRQDLWLEHRTLAHGYGRNACKSCTKPQKLSIKIVLARTKEDTSWLDIYLGRIPHIVYQVTDANAEHTTQLNKGKEAMPYLQYIIDQYEQLPDVSVFTHGAMYVRLTTANLL